MLLDGLTPDEMVRLIPLRPIFIGTIGSHSHGTYMPPVDPTSVDDIDLLVVYIPPGLDHLFGLRSIVGRTGGRHVAINQWDSAAYELREYVDLLEGNNPNIMSGLWLDEKHWRFADGEWKWLVEHRDLFSSKRAYYSFGKYARAQLHRMTSAKSDVDCCTGEEFHLPTCPTTLTRGRGSQKRFATGHLGIKRKGLVQRFGYDVKNAAHLIRLLRTAAEFLRTGNLQVDRTGIDADELMAIKRGEHTLQEIDVLATLLFTDLDLALAQSGLPAEPARDRIDQLLTSIMATAKMADVALVGNQFLTEGLIRRQALKLIVP